ncbi:amidase family protein [Thermicanus aegyptius]|uniref:amidase family protein n=1 Tax=Thermicanus aegyptius TaxID=94009 RepID=UPI00048CE0F7|nr:amidase family protein [Thermicanus aegyptius]
MTKMEWMERFAYAYANAYRYTDSIVWVNPTAPTSARKKLEQHMELILFGVKDTDQIPMNAVRQLIEAPDFVWMTVDRMAPYGRAMDPGLTNPLTGRLMTGSSSGSALNILRGIHDLAIVTDGGGSILGPALATQLYGINAKGMGLTGLHPSRSTDGFSLEVGIGVISHSFAFAKSGIETLLCRTLDDHVEGLYIALDRAAPDNVEDLLRQYGCTIRRFDKGDSYERTRGLSLMNELFNENQVIISMEGPVDVKEYADSLVMDGRPDGLGGKFLLRSANLANTTSVAVPGNKAASGFIVIAPSGVESGNHAIAVAGLLAKHYPRSALFEDYFLRRMRYGQTGFFHEGM